MEPDYRVTGSKKWPGSISDEYTNIPVHKHTIKRTHHACSTQTYHYTNTPVHEHTITRTSQYMNTCVSKMWVSNKILARTHQNEIELVSENWISIGSLFSFQRQQHWKCRNHRVIFNATEHKFIAQNQVGTRRRRNSRHIYIGILCRATLSLYRTKFKNRPISLCGTSRLMYIRTISCSALEVLLVRRYINCLL